MDNDCDGRTDEGCIGDYAWRDSNENGLQDSGEAPLFGVTFRLRQSSTGALIAVAVSDTFGKYYFSGVPPGSYFIEVVPPQFFTVTSNDVGADDALDSDFDGETLASPPFNLVDSRFDIDCGFTTAPGF